MDHSVAQTAQEKLRNQMHTLEKLEAAFLENLWIDRLTPDQSSERHQRLTKIFDEAGDLPAHLLVRLFCLLEYKAQQEVRKTVVLAQTTEPERLSSQLPPTLIANTKAVHEHAFITRQSEQCSMAGKHKRPGRQHEKREIVENLLKDWINSGRLEPTRRGDKAKFVKHIIDEISPKENWDIQRSQTLYRWVNEYLSQNLGAPNAIDEATAPNH